MFVRKWFSTLHLWKFRKDKSSVTSNRWHYITFFSLLKKNVATIEFSKIFMTFMNSQYLDCLESEDDYVKSPVLIQSCFIHYPKLILCHKVISLLNPAVIYLPFLCHFILVIVFKLSALLSSPFLSINVMYNMTFLSLT